jgi:predicted DNA-binding transcriptional regulator AlpA
VAVELAALPAAVGARLAVAGTNGHPVAEERLLTIDQAGERLGVTKNWLRHRPELPFGVKLSEGVVRYSAKGIERYIAARTGRRGGPC